MDVYVFGPVCAEMKQQKKMRTIADTIADLDKMLISAKWIKEEFLNARIRQAAGLCQQEKQKTTTTKIFFCWRSASDKNEAKSESESQAEPKEWSVLSEELSGELSKNLHYRLLDHAIYSHKQLEDVAMQTGGLTLLYEILQCKGAAEAITKYYDNLKALKESLGGLAGKWKTIELALTGELESLDAFLMNYGLAAALIAGAAMSNFASIAKDDWLAYLPLALREVACQDLAKEHCGLEALSPDHLGWGDLYCKAAVDKLIEDPNMKLTEDSDLSCCIEALECAKTTKWKLELGYTIGCAGASAAMLLVVLFSAWLYIALHASSANRERFDEAKLLRERFKDEIFIVHILFSAGVVFGFVGIVNVISLKVGTLALSWAAFGITVAAAILALVLFVKCPLEVYWLNQTIDEERKFNKKQLVDKYEKALKDAPIKKLADLIKVVEERRRDDKVNKSEACCSSRASSSHASMPKLSANITASSR